ncbi:MAG: DUF11 domain-containing protein [Actinobacteria bacterium]|nr:DUF11 domain-containing protein [Actinomycetota bacterium]
MEGQVILMTAPTPTYLARWRALAAMFAVVAALMLALASTAAAGAESRTYTGCWPWSYSTSTARTGTLCVTYGYIKIVKVAQPDDSSASFGFKLDGSSSAVFTSAGSGYSDWIKVTSGTHSIAEVAPADWNLNSATCSNGYGTLSGKTLSGVKVNTDQKVTCTFTNVQQPKPATLKVVKQVVNDNGGTLAPADFSLWVKSGGSHVSGSPAPGSSAGTSYTLPAGSYVVGETQQEGYTSSIWGDCAANGSVTLAAGQSKTCTITNNDVINPAISIVKSANPTLIYRGESTTYTIVVTNSGDDPLTNVVLGDDTCSPLVYVSGDEGAPGVLEVGQSWSFTCTTSLSESTLNTVNVTAEDSGGGTVAAMAVAYVEVIDRPVTPPVGPTPEPTVTTQSVLSVTLARRNRCISQRFTIRPAISGGTPVKTVLKIDGKRRAATKSANPKFVVNTARYKAGRTHRVEVTVTFRDGRTARARSSFTRCSAAGAVNPRFTG